MYHLILQVYTLQHLSNQLYPLQVLCRAPSHSNSTLNSCSASWNTFFISTPLPPNLSLSSLKPPLFPSCWLSPTLPLLAPCGCSYYFKNFGAGTHGCEEICSSVPPGHGYTHAHAPVTTGYLALISLHRVGHHHSRFLKSCGGVIFLHKSLCSIFHHPPLISQGKKVLFH